MVQEPVQGVTRVTNVGCTVPCFACGLVGLLLIWHLERACFIGGRAFLPGGGYPMRGPPLVF